MNYILLTFYSEMCKDTWFSPLTHAMRGMARENIKLKKKITGPLCILECLYYYFKKLSFSTLESAPLPPSLASVSSIVQNCSF